ncbi:beta-L-arabinofuranosidase domain-containing protein [Lacticaseibacillus casei]|uniref:beta-L-arabinofuranosidase domain-containing protein n=1 Tax=Lacticaseibacillus casei TaxID=1582 RepID=UPI00226BCDB2|nr:beta-L-arabinofuranosidase domain-containing protein [Lacticaseibacillus casei]
MKIENIKVTDPFWTKYRTIVKDKLIPYQWSVINDDRAITIEKENAGAYDAVEKSHAVENLKIAAGLAKGHFYGFWFQDSDVYKWLEAVAYALRYAPDKRLEGIANNVIDIISQAQEPDGYLDTYIQIEAPEHKFTHVSLSHELYVMGHYIEAGVAYYQTTHYRKALDIAKKMGDCIDANFGPEDKKMHGYPGHPEIELALAKLADETGDVKYTRVAKYMIDQRGTRPNNFFEEQLKNVQAKKIEDPTIAMPASRIQNHLTSKMTCLFEK